MALPGYGPISFSDINTELGYPAGQKISLGDFTGSYTIQRTQRDSTDVAIYAGTNSIYSPFLNTYGVWTSPDFTTPSDGRPQAVTYTTYLQYGGTFTLTASADNRVEVYIGGVQVIQQAGYTITSSVPVTLPAGTVKIRIVARNDNPGSKGLFGVAIYNTTGDVIWSTRYPLTSGPLSINEVITGTGWAPYLAQGIPTPMHGNNNVDRLHGKANIPIGSITIGGYVNFGGFNHGSSETPHFTLASQAARPQNISGTMSFTTGGNNTTHFEIHNQNRIIATIQKNPQGNAKDWGVHNWTYTWSDTIASYASNTYWCRSYTSFVGDYNYMRAADSFNNFTFSHVSWAGN